MSKKRYGSSSTARPEPAPTFFLDENIGSTDVAGALREAGARVEVYRDHFSGAVDDEEWIELVAARGWVAITKDELKARPIEREALIAGGVRAFVLTSRELTGPEMAQLFRSCFARMVRECAVRPGPFIVYIGRSGFRVDRHIERRRRRRPRESSRVLRRARAPRSRDRRAADPAAARRAAHRRV